MEGYRGDGSQEEEWELETPDGIHRYRMRIDADSVPPVLICTVGGADSFGYKLRCVSDLYQMLVDRGDWVDLGIKDEKGTPAEGTVEAWARSADNPVAGWYGLKPGWRGRFATYVPPLLEFFGLAELEHKLTGNRMKAIPIDELPTPASKGLWRSTLGAAPITPASPAPRGGGGGGPFQSGHWDLRPYAPNVRRAYCS